LYFGSCSLAGFGYGCSPDYLTDFVWKTSKFTIYLYSELEKNPTLVAYRTTVAIFCDLSIRSISKELIEIN
jgi:hypothetical protein